jgi:hypothetical protein
VKDKLAAILKEAADPISKIRDIVTQTALVLSGDTHVFEAFMPTDTGQPVQLIVGTGGDTLEKPDMLGAKPMEPQKANLFAREGTLWGKVAFGFVMLTREAQGWSAMLYDVAGKPVLRCDLSGRSCSAM